jgi:hypothetical protein
MARKIEAGHYEVGRIEQQRGGPRPRKTGSYGAIKGENIESNGHLEWSHICEGIIKRSRWCAYRIGPGDGGTGTRTDLLQSFDSKQAALDYLERRFGSEFDETY